MADTEWQFDLIQELRLRLLAAIERCWCWQETPGPCERCEADLKWLDENG